MPRRTKWLCVASLIFVLLTALSSAGAPGPAIAAGDVSVYTDALGSGWANWSWDTTADFSNGSPTHGGSASLAVTYNAAWAGLYLHSNSNLYGGDYTMLRFWIRGTAASQNLNVALYDGSYQAAAPVAITAPNGSWSKVELTLAALGNPASISGVVWQDSTGRAQPVFYLDDVTLVAGSTPPGPGPALQVNAAAGQHSISLDIYGMNFADEALATNLRLPVRRWGGNATTRYNWQNDTSNHASDWYFENLANPNSNPSALPDGSSSDQFVEQDRRTGTRTLLTVPLIGWTPKARATACSFSVNLYGAQQSTDPWQPDCGNGKHTNGSPITDNDPTDTSTAIGPSFVQGWINHLIGRYGTAANGGVALYDLDNEPMLWDDTHRDVHPQPTNYDEMRDRTYAYAAAIKATDPGAHTLGPVAWGWTAYFWSALDWAPGGSWWNNPQDRNAHGGTPFVDWYLQQMQAYEQAHGTRILDYLDLHYYPQADGVALQPAGSAATQALRLRSTGGLWDPTYTDESWIGEPVRLIPRMKEWVSNNYPGTKLAITEYNWGALDSLNGALAQADVLGIFGREGLDLATLWDPPSSSEPGAFAFRMYRNYDGAGSAFGDTSVSASSTDQGALAIYAARRNADGALTLMIINKGSSDLTADVTLAGFDPAGSAQVYRYSGANLNAIVRQADQAVTASGFSATFPGSSITLIVVPSATEPLKVFVPLVAGKP
jgi:hypothetical protein